MATAASQLAIDIQGVEKVFPGKIHALRGVDMQLAQGEIFGLLGPNGAGKSTLVKILMTVVRPTRCRGQLLGRPVGDKRALARVGYLPEHHRFPPYLTARQVLDFYAALSGVPRPERRRRAEQLLETVDLTEWAGRKIGGFSKGMRQRLGIAQSLMNDPELVLLDEPTDGVDPVGRRDIRDIVKRLRQEGRAVLINSHLLSELEVVCDRVAILVKGAVGRQGTLDELTAGQRCYEIHLQGDPVALPPQLCSILPAAFPAEQVDETGLRKGALTAGPAIEVSGSDIRIDSDDPMILQPVIDCLRGGGFVIASIRRYRPSLEDLFIQAVTDPQTGDILTPGAPPAARRRGREAG